MTKPVIIPDALKNITEVDTHFLIKDGNKLIYASNESGDYQIYQYCNGKIELLWPEQKNMFRPYRLKNAVDALIDSTGGEQFYPLSDKVKPLLGSSPLQFIISSNSGNLLVYQIREEPYIYLYNLSKDEKTTLYSMANRFFGAAFSETDDHLIISVDNQLIHYNVRNKTFKNLASVLAGKKFNPFVYHNHVFFSNRDRSEYYQIYRQDFLDGGNPQLVLSTNADLRLPKFDGKDLYFIEISNSEYLLKKMNSYGDETQIITNKGVVYNFEFLGKDTLAYVYSDFQTPRSILLSNKKSGNTVNLSGNPVIFGASYDFVESTNKKSTAYIFRPKKSTPTQGVVLFFHGHPDFSPRWDTILMSLVYHGYIVIAPNYPTSFGYGKSYHNARFNVALEDLIAWKNFIIDTYDYLPLYYFSVSSGNLLMEAMLTQDHKNVEKAVSLFGIAGSNNPRLKIPTLYILGKMDPLVDFQTRYHNLIRYRNNGNTNISIKVYSGEGHWLKNKEAILAAQTEILKHYQR